MNIRSIGAPVLGLVNGRASRWVALALGALSIGVVVIAQTTTPSFPLVQLSPEPLYMNGVKAKANLTLAISVEFPTVGQTYRDEFDSKQEYVGYFDPKSCYKHVPANGGAGEYFDWTGAAKSSGDCGGGGFNGNFMNWATSSAIDIMRYGLTGGNRVVDEGKGNGRTIVERAYLPDNFYRNGTYFGIKRLPKSLVSSMIESSVANKIPGDLYIMNCRERVYFATAYDNFNGSTCENPFNGQVKDSNGVDYLAGPTANRTFYEVRNLVCDPNSAANRPELCLAYPGGWYKPVGEMQKNSDNLRIAVFGYLQDNSRQRNGGVLRAPMKYVGPKKFDANFNEIAAINERREWDANTGVFIDNPEGDTNYTKSGAIMYINKFGTLDPNNYGSYKALDPVSELYYESLRYLQGQQPSPDAIAGITGNPKDDTKAADGSSLKVGRLVENFPAYTAWTDPMAGFVDSRGDQPTCARNSVLGIGDVFTHSDRTVPGNTITGNQDKVRAAGTLDPDIPYWTSIVASFETNGGVEYVDSKGRKQKASNPNSGLYTSLASMATDETGSNGGSYYMAGAAYWANTQSFRKDLPKARVRTYMIDVNENRSSDDRDFRRTRQFFLAAKYGGFDDDADGSNFTGNPYKVIGGKADNSLWEDKGAPGEANSYFRVDNAKRFLESLKEVFRRAVEETGSIAGGAISTQRITAKDAAAVYQARFNPKENYWSGRLLKYPLVLNTAGDAISVSDTATWDAGALLTATGATARNIVVGPPAGKSATVSATPFVWSSLTADHQAALNLNPQTNTSDSLGSARVSYLRGDQSKEQTAAKPTEPFRQRDLVLGDIVNSGLVYTGKPESNIVDADYQKFFDANKSRKPVIYAGANDGMLHAFYDEDGTEAFAYVPGVLVPRLNQLTSPKYTHQSYVDATPVVAEAKIGATPAWKTVLVSGMGGGAQGVFALDVTDPTKFGSNSVIWEFTDKDSKELGNVVGAPHIVKLRSNSTTDKVATYKWYAMFASGVNNYRNDGAVSARGYPSIYILDLSKDSTAAWSEGANFWRIELPQKETSIASGASGLTTVRGFGGETQTIYAGDLQGNLWKLNMAQGGVADLGTDGLANSARLSAFTTSSAASPFFVAYNGGGTAAVNRQPIFAEPAVANAFNGAKVVMFGTGKYIETADVSDFRVQSFYALFDDGVAKHFIKGRDVLQAGTIKTDGTIDTPQIRWGWTDSSTSTKKAGWYFDFLDSSKTGERQISDITIAFGKAFFGSVTPTVGACGEGGGSIYSVGIFTGDGLAKASEVGVLASPLVIEVNNPSLTKSDAVGQRTASQRIAIITQGSKGIAAPAALASTESNVVGRLSWRQLWNYEEIKNK